MGVYAEKGIEKTLKDIMHWLEDSEIGVKMIIGGNFNARTGREGVRYKEKRKMIKKRMGLGGS